MVGSVPEIPGIRATGELLRAFRQEVADLLGRRSIGFPGAQPVSFAARHKFELQKQDYYVCEKSDGIRCLMYHTQDEAPEGKKEVVYLIDRKNDYYWVQDLHFPLPGFEQQFHLNTLVDGELVNDKLPNGGTQLKYLVFDCLFLDGNSLMHRTLDKRLAYFRENVFKPYQELYRKYPEEIQHLPFIIDFKPFELGYGIEKMFREVLPKLPHGNDGLIFTCRNTPYQFGTDPHILKWKPPEENTIDFLLQLDFPTIEPDEEDIRNGFTSSFPDYSAKPQCRLLVYKGDDDYLQWSTMFVEDSEWEHLKSLAEPLNDRIVECFLDARNRWRFHRFRDDKTEANHISTVESVMESIQDRVTEEDLIGAAKKIRDEWKKRQASGQTVSVLEANGRSNQAPQAQFDADSRSRREGSLGSKRKLDDGDDRMDGHDHDGVKRRNTPQAAP
ncbi:MAG: hypothetical protein L6R39_001963 [Caloplaca ligustica]|nr:MAG: hypothetical protein L6R39_001963 [Caloplaca ligustica]